MEQSIGDIYMIRNKINGKVYIGQALKYTGRVQLKWGTNGRWKSHIREAFQENAKDHCVHLNNALRFYGVEAFEVSTLCECMTTDEMNEKEAEYIELHNAMHPNGYNLNYGGAKGKDSDETREKKRLMRLGKKHTDDVKDKISKGQLGNRRGPKKRTYPEDESLPKYINAMRKDGKIIGYAISCFPIGVDVKKYISRSFSNSKTPQEALHLALKNLEELQEKYKHIEDNKSTVEMTNEASSYVERKARDGKKGADLYNMPKYISMIQSGFIVDGLRIIKDDGKIGIHKKKFQNQQLSMEEKLAMAIAHLEEIKKTKKCLIDDHVNPPNAPKKKIVHLKKLNSESAHNSRLPEPMEKQ